VVSVALGLEEGRLPSWATSPQVGTALSLFTAATLALTAGVGLARARGTDTPGVLSPHPTLLAAGLIFAVAGGALLWTGVMRMGILSMGYAEYFEQGMRADVRLFGFGLMLFSIGLIVAAVGATARGMFGLGLLFAVALGPLFLNGFRGPVLVQGAALLAVWVRKDARTAKRLATAGLVAVLLLVPAIKVSRNAGASLSDALRETDALAFLHESGGSLRPLVVTCERLESSRDPLWMGRSYLMAARRLVPNVSTAWVAPTRRALTPAVWATMHADYWAYEHGLGIGFSGVAEPYLNFGAPGVVVFFVILGVLLAAGDRWLSAGGYRAAMVAASFGFVLWTVRNDMNPLLRTIAVACFAVATAWVLSRTLAHRVRGRQPRSRDDSCPPQGEAGEEVRT
jgi:oligosaccharide repeat unit polymerase